MKRTKLMEKLFSDSTPEEFKATIAEKIEESRANGSSEFIDGDDEYQFADIGDSVIVEDKASDEITSFTDNPDDPDDFVSEAVEINKTPESEVTVTSTTETPVEEETKVESEPANGANGSDAHSQPNVQEQIPESTTNGGRVTETVPHIDVRIDEGIQNDDKAGLGTNRFYSVRISGVTDERKVFSLMSAIRKSFAETEEAKDSDVKPEETHDLNQAPADKVEHMKETKTESEDTATEEAMKEVQKAAKDLLETVKELEETQSKETAEKVKTECDKIILKVDELEAKGKDFGDLKKMILKASEDSAKVLDLPDGTAVTKETDADGTEVNIETPKPTSMKVLLGEGDEEEDIVVNPNDSATAGKVFSNVEHPETSNPYLDTQF